MEILLTERQRQIVKLIAEGHNRESIANQLGISPGAVHGHLDRLFKQLQVNSVLEVLLKLYDWKEKAG
jgi:DNA-binding CsgD family transcriptional regulator